jgi:hypothetical protein
MKTSFLIVERYKLSLPEMLSLNTEFKKFGELNFLLLQLKIKHNEEKNFGDWWHRVHWIAHRC